MMQNFSDSAHSKDTSTLHFQQQC